MCRILSSRGDVLLLNDAADSVRPIVDSHRATSTAPVHRANHGRKVTATLGFAK
jgi:hypothetical protein